MKNLKKSTKIIIFIVSILLISTGIIGYKAYKYYQTIPEISLNGSSNITLNLGENYEEYGATSSFQGQDTTSSISIEGDIDINKVGEYELTYTTLNSITKKSSSIKRIVNVVDTTPPTISLQGENNISLYVNDSYQEPGYTATDNYDGDITAQVVKTGEVASSKPGTYELTYSVSDSSSNTYEIKRTITVKERPVIKPASPTINKSVPGLPVLMYHFFYDDTKGQTGADANWMAKTAFEEQMKYLSDNNYYFPTWQEVEDYVNGKIGLPAKSIVVTIDDGDVTFIDHAIPIIEKYNVKATSFAVTVWTGESLANSYKDPSKTHLNIQSHSYDAHKAGRNGKGLLVNMTYDEAYNDLKKSKDLTNNSTVFCYPFGHYNDTVIQALKDTNYHLAFTTKSGRVYPGQNPYALPRVRMSRGITLDKFIEKVS